MAQRDVESFADFIQYYQHHYVRSAIDPRVMFYVNGPSDHGRPFRRVLMSSYNNGKAINETHYTEEEVWKLIQFGLPAVGMTVFGKQELVYLYYRTARNGGRGFSADRVIQHSFNGFNLQAHGLVKFSPADIQKPWAVWEALTPTHTTLEQAWNDFENPEVKQLAYTLSQHFGVYLSHKEYPKLCYRMIEIGDVLGPNKVRLDVKHAEYREPIRRILNPNMEIEVNESR